MSKNYQVATVDPFISKLSISLSMITNGNYKVSFYQSASHWVAKVYSDVFKGFTNDLILPVLYRIHQVEPMYTVEELFSNYKGKNLQNILYLHFPRNVGEENGFLYIGAKISLKGGMFGALDEEINKVIKLPPILGETVEMIKKHPATTTGIVIGGSV